MLFKNPLAVFGAYPKGERLARVLRSVNYREGRFQNPVVTHTILPGTGPQTLRMQFEDVQARSPFGPIPIVSLTARDFAYPPASGLRVTWLGHATALIEIDGQRVLVDPVWSRRVSPSQLFGPARFHPPPLALDQIPPLDAIVVSHDHYDHLDMATVQTLAKLPSQQAAVFVTSIGVGAHLERWGVPAHRIVELDWTEGLSLGTLTITATPARHFSGRGLRDGNKTFWSSWVIAGLEHRVFHSGDTGALPLLSDVGHQYGPFDMALIAIGAYGPTWPEIHLNPEEGVAAFQQVLGKVMLPIHWGTFKLAFHPWSEPAERVLAAATRAGISLTIPRPGQPVEPVSPPPIETWWRAAVGDKG